MIAHPLFPAFDWVPALLGLLATVGAHAQVVTVTLQFDSDRIEVGTTATLRAIAQIVPQQRPGTDRIFSWYVDLLNAAGSIASADFASSKRPASDQDPRTSSSGTTDGPNQRGVHDTFINLPGAGREAPVELFSVPVKGLAPGRATFRVQPGSGVAGLDADFIVAPGGGGEPLLGGEYSDASAELEVIAPAQAPRLSITSAALPLLRQRLTITFPTTPGQNHFVEFRTELNPGSDWQAAPGGPHNTGILTDTNSLPRRFYRLRLAP